ncbi:cob(I)yrinic acid a,c-diamide adenosyltransferase [candidate division WWE3 bacterium]|nr:cob(I)yrinic acid a,c-diamide adenosyltransferase [candidate division WWE3 bacterium]
MSIYTRTGDNGTTGTFGGNRMKKSEPLFSVLGSLDELNCWVGLLIASCKFTVEARDVLVGFQNDLLVLGAFVGNPSTKPKAYLDFFSKTRLLENLIDELENSLTPLNNFILPGGSESSAICHLCRSVCRRAERELVSFFESSKLKEECPEFLEAIKFLNRMSDFFFVMARKLNELAGVRDVIWNVTESKV